VRGGCQIYVLNLRKALNRKVKLMLSNGSRKVRICNVDEKLLEEVMELIWCTAERLIDNKLNPGDHCEYCGKENCPKRNRVSS